MHTFELITGIEGQNSVSWPAEPVQRVLVIGHGALAMRQAPTYQHWLDQGVDVHCADVDEAKLEDCLSGIHRYVLPRHEANLLSKAPFDLVCVSNIPSLHLATALHFGTYAKRIVIQKPQDLNYPLIEVIAEARGYEDFRSKTVIHDHYRNKSAFVALLEQLPMLMRRYGKFTKVMFFLTEAKSVSDEPDRAQSLECGMIQDLAVHQIDLMLECLLKATEFRFHEDDERINRRERGTIQIVNCIRMKDQTSILGDHVETFAALDIRVSETLRFEDPSGRLLARYPHSFDVLIAVGKGIAIEQGVAKDCKAIVLEFERPGFYSVVDLASLGVREVEAGIINRRHGGMNRPLLLLSPNPPDHAIHGPGGPDFAQWQSLALGKQIAGIAMDAQSFGSAQGLAAYPYRRPLGDLIRELVSTGKLRGTWNVLPPLTTFQIEDPRPADYID